jgi:hypothetical protein
MPEEFIDKQSTSNKKTIPLFPRRFVPLFVMMYISTHNGSKDGRRSGNRTNIQSNASIGYLLSEK